MEPLPESDEAPVVFTSAESTRPVTRRERGRLVEEEQLREPSRLQERRSAPAAELEPARDPAPPGVPPADSPLRIMEAAAIAVDEPARRVGDQVAERRHTIW